MSILRIEGGHPLKGEVYVQGAKNSVLPILASCALIPGQCVIHRCPALSDVDHALECLEWLGCQVERTGETLVVDSSGLSGHTIPDRLMRQMRSSVLFLGSVLARTGQVELSYPGGCELGPRPIDLHLDALRALGAQVEEGGGTVRCRGRLTAGEITLSTPSVGATENAILAATAAEGATTIVNAAREPEIVDLQGFLNAMGANIQGAGSSLITVQGGRKLHGGEYTVMPDRIVACTYLAALAATGGEGRVLGVDWRHLSTVTAMLTEAGCQVSSTAHSVSLTAPRRLKAVRPIRTAPYPGFPTDAQALAMATLSKAEGTTLVVENLFDSRYRHVDELRRMGADIRTEGRVALIRGVEELSGTDLTAADLRGGAALAIAALSGTGESTLSGLGHIDRGYADLAGDLRQLGGHVCREEES